MYSLDPLECSESLRGRLLLVRRSHLGNIAGDVFEEKPNLGKKHFHLRGAVFWLRQDIKAYSVLRA